MAAQRPTAADVDPTTDEPSAAAPAVDAPARRGPAPRGQLALAVVACTVGAALALWASSKNWSELVTHRPYPLPDVHTTRSGGDFVPWVPALALISLAGAGALVATRRIGRRIVGVLLVLAGLGMAGGAAYGLADAAGSRGFTGVGWPLVALLGGLAVVAVGVLTVRAARRWPTMGSRYERVRPAGQVSADDDPAKVWDALDNGEDPTGR